MEDHCHAIDQAQSNASQGAFLPTRERDLYFLDPAPKVLGDLDPSCQGLIFPDSGLEAPDLESIMGDSVPDDIKERFLIATRVSHIRNQEKVQNLDSTIRSLYTMASGLVNDGVEALRGYRKVQTALNVCQQSIWRKSGPFVKPTTSKAATRPGKDKATPCAMAKAANTAKKKRSRDRGERVKVYPPMLHFILSLCLQQPHCQPLQCLHFTSFVWMPGLNTSR